MVRTKYLAYKGKWQELTVITREKFLEIIKSNKEATGTERRYFIADFIEESWGIDCLVIETSAEVHHKWSVEHNKVYRNRKYRDKNSYVVLSLDAEFSGENSSQLEFLPETMDENGYDTTVSDITLEQLRGALKKWRPWAEEMMNFYISGKKRSCNAFFAEKYGVSGRQVEQYKKQFEEFVKKFLC